LISISYVANNREFFNGINELLQTIQLYYLQEKYGGTFDFENTAKNQFKWNSNGK
jgi:hypothetical protein